MPRLPRDCSGKRIVRLLEKNGYTVVRQRGSHVRLYSDQHDHSITIPDHEAIRVGTLNNIINDVAMATGIPNTTLLEEL